LEELWLIYCRDTGDAATERIAGLSWLMTLLRRQDGFSLFVTRLIQAGAIAFWSSLRTGHVEQLVPMMVALGGIGHFILIFAALLALLRHNAETGKWWKFLGGGVLAVAYFVLIVAFAQPH
jgi:hypothetical protein